MQSDLKGDSDMPVISRFYGIIIRMNFIQAEHNPPHTHAIYGENTAKLQSKTVPCLMDIFLPKP